MKVTDGQTRMRLVVERLDALEIPESLVDLRRLTGGDAAPHRTTRAAAGKCTPGPGFMHADIHVSGQDARTRDLPISVAAPLIAEACNVGLVPVTDCGTSREFSLVSVLRGHHVVPDHRNTVGSGSVQ